MELEITDRGDVVHVRAPRLTRRGLLEALRDDRAAGEAVTAVLREVRFPAFCWELPPLTPESASRGAEFVLVDSPSLARVRADHGPFDEPLAGCAGAVGTFENLGGDALLVVPQPRSAPGSAHLAAFVRKAPADVVATLWSEVGRAACERLDTGPWPFWVSTAGLGVYWLHVRLDARPKYYRHRPYTSQTA